MLIKAKTLTGYELDSLDGKIGRVIDFYFDDRHWAIRYLAADTGTWMPDRQVLISPYALVDVTKNDRYISVALTKQEIEKSPALDSDKPLSRHFEETYFEHYGWPAYWDGPYMWGSYPSIERDREKGKTATQIEKPWDHHLRSINALNGYHIQASDGEIGHVEDFIIDDETWAIRYLIINTRNWWPGKKVLVSPQWIERVSWEESTIFISLTRETIIQSPEYNEEFLPSRDYEDKLHRHYNRQGYWAENGFAKKHSRKEN